MIWAWVIVLALVSMAPLAAYASRGSRLRGRQEAALSLHRAQLQELERELTEGRLVTEEYTAARLEVQRRLLADAALSEVPPPRSGFGGIVLVALLVPAVALGLYLKVGQPDFPPEDAAVQGGPPMTAAEQEKAARDDALIAQLRARLKLMEPHAAHTIEGYEVLGRAELSRGHLPEAAEAWKVVLADQFDATLAVQTAEVLTEASGRVTPEALALFRKALAAAPADAPWRPMARKRIAEAGG
jgi:cytochrome c-type biogenesis protein CcmH